MAWLVFGLFFLASDHAPWWVYAAFLAGFVLDYVKEAGAAATEAVRHRALLIAIRNHSG